MNNKTQQSNTNPPNNDLLWLKSSDLRFTINTINDAEGQAKPLFKLSGLNCHHFSLEEFTNNIQCIGKCVDDDDDDDDENLFQFPRDDGPLLLSGMNSTEYHPSYQIPTTKQTVSNRYSTLNSSHHLLGVTGSGVDDDDGTGQVGPIEVRVGQNVTHLGEGQVERDDGKQ